MKDVCANLGGRAVDKPGLKYERINIESQRASVYHPIYIS
jgi:hypothetical protein